LGAGALTVGAYVYWRESGRLTSHGELWEYKRRLAKEMGEWVGDAWARATEMHACLYEGWFSGEDVEASMMRVRQLVEEVASRIRKGKISLGLEQAVLP